MDNKMGLSNLKFIDEDGNEKEIASGVAEIGVDISNKEDASVDGMFLSDGEVTFDISDTLIKKYHRKKKGKRYLPYYVEEYLLFDDFKHKVFGIKGKYKKYRKVGSKKYYDNKICIKKW